MVLGTLLAALALAAPCPEPVSPTSLTSRAEDALLAFATLDEGGFAVTAEEALAVIPCLDAPVGVTQAAVLHRMVALHHLTTNDDGAAIAELQAAYVLQPDYVLSRRLAPEGGRLDRLERAARLLAPPALEPLPLPEEAEVWVDGARGRQRHTGFPVLVQVQPGEAPLWSTYVHVGGELALPPALGATAADTGPVPAVDPDAAAAADAVEPLPTEPSPIVDPPRRNPSRRTVLLASAGATGALAVGSFAASLAYRKAYEEDPSDRLATAANVTYGASLGLGVVTAGLVTVALVGGNR